MPTTPDHPVNPRWDRLAELLERAVAALKEGRFDYDFYFSVEDSVGGRDGVAPPAVVEGEVDWCGTSACFAGLAISTWQNPLWILGDSGRLSEIQESDNTTYEVEAADLLGLSPEEARGLFCSIPARELQESVLASSYSRVREQFHKDVDRWEVEHGLDELGIRYLRMCVEAKKMFPTHEAVRALTLAEFGDSE